MFLFAFFLNLFSVKFATLLRSIRVYIIEGCSCDKTSRGFYVCFVAQAEKSPDGSQRIIRQERRTFSTSATSVVSSVT
jgi:hypothetical protein